MLCPYCQQRGDRVVDSRETQQGRVIRRRRECLHCGRRRTTYERTEEVPRMVVKKGGRREPFERAKTMAGLMRACKKRPVSSRQMEEIVDAVESRLRESAEGEITSADIGALLMERLKHLDHVAYVRFASVYREYEDVRQFLEEIRDL